MQSIVTNKLFQDRAEAGYQLGKALTDYSNTNAVVVGIPRGGVCVAAVIAEMLSLPLEVIPCRKIRHPADSTRTIGSVSEDDVFIHDCSHTIPQDYVYHQIVLLRSSIAHQRKEYYGSTRQGTFRDRIVIIVDDLLSNSDTLIACLRSIRKQNPLKVIVAVPIVGADAARIVGAEADELKCIRTEPVPGHPFEYFVKFPRIDDKKVKELFVAARQKVSIHK
jgi:predicted phosphoribosyltransferase